MSTSERKTPTATRVLTTLAVAGIAMAAVGTSVGHHDVDQPAYTVLFGEKIVFHQDMLNYGNSHLRDCDGPGTSCWSIRQPNGEAISSAEVRNDADTRHAEALVGVKYVLVPACNGQDTTFGFTATYGFNYTLTTDRSLGTGSALAAIHLRPTGTSETPPHNITATDGEDKGTSAPTSVTLSLASDLNRTYYTTLGARSTAAVAADLPEANDFATASAYASLKDIALDFGDITAPRSEHTLDTRGAANGGQSFIGWYKTHPTVTVRAWDPVVNVNNEVVPHSCVKHVEVKNNGVLYGAPLEPGFHQQNVTKTFSEERRYNLLIQAVDYAGKTQESPISLSFGVDTLPPVTTVVPNPATVNGNNSWYKKPASGASVAWKITCDDSNGLAFGDYAGCTRTNFTHSDGASGFQAIAASVNVTAKEGGSVHMTASSLDRSNNGGPATTSPTIKVDLTPPPVNQSFSVLPEFNNGWWRVPVTVSVGCNNSTELSGCAHTRTRINGTGAWTNITSYTFSKQANYVVSTEAEDEAGNVGVANPEARIDVTLPGLPQNARLDPPGQVVGGVNYVNFLPTFKWDAASDVPSGVRHYRVELDGNFLTNATTRQVTLSSAADGYHNLTIRAVDQAGNVGSAVRLPFVLDRTAPTSEFLSPLSGRIYFWDGTTRALANPAATSIVLGPVYVNLTGADAPFSSGLKSTKIHETLNGNATLPCNPGNASSCSFHEAPVFGLEQGSSERVLVGWVFDYANNGAKADLRYVRVDLGIFRTTAVPGGLAASSSTPTATLFWKPSSDPSLQKYEIHRSTSPHFAPTYVDNPVTGAPKTHVTDVPAGTTTWDDTLTSGAYYYKVVHVNGAGVGLTHETLFNYSSTAEVGEAQPCGEQGSFTCV